MWIWVGLVKHLGVSTKWVIFQAPAKWGQKREHGQRSEQGRAKFTGFPSMLIFWHTHFILKQKPVRKEFGGSLGRRESLKLVNQYESLGRKETLPKRNWSTLPRKFDPKNWTASPSKRVSESWNSTLPRKFGSENWSKFASTRDGEQKQQRDSSSAPLLPRRNSMSSQSSNIGRGTYQQVFNIVW